MFPLPSGDEKTDLFPLARHSFLREAGQVLTPALLNREYYLLWLSLRLTVDTFQVLFIVLLLRGIAD